jgi:hypothetical protein
MVHAGKQLKQNTYMKTGKIFSAKMRCTGGRISKSFGGWLAECERQDAWHERTQKEKKPTLTNVRDFLSDYDNWQQESN